MPTLPITEIAGHVGGELVGDTTLRITGAETLELAQPGQITFIGEAKYAPLWETSRASAALVDHRLAVEPGQDRAIIKVKNADLAMAQLLDLLAPPAVRPQEGVHPTAVVDVSAKLGSKVCIGPLCVIGARVVLGDGVVLHSGATVMDECVIGAGTELFSGVVIRERCSLGQRCILHANVVIGADGFGYRPAPD
ncbi:MAG: UDP-3-O-(3-hydroxymyristoyl)glucosamine N-acyltransferase, partial [Phycisphaerales bacterium]|nr:UDP-3-O-(3-hydroxymyristoyl)glucosamine N-acyltransferase [Phycisphaerales bacterium]